MTDNTISPLDFGPTIISSILKSDTNKVLEMTVSFTKDTSPVVNLDVFSGTVGDKSKRNTEYSGESMAKAIEAYNKLTP